MLRSQKFLKRYSAPVLDPVQEFNTSTNEVIDCTDSTGNIYHVTKVKRHSMQLSDFVDIADDASNYSIEVLQSAGIALSPCPTYEHADIDTLSQYSDALESEVLPFPQSDSQVESQVEVQPEH